MGEEVEGRDGIRRQCDEPTPAAISDKYDLPSRRSDARCATHPLDNRSRWGEVDTGYRDSERKPRMNDMVWTVRGHRAAMGPSAVNDAPLLLHLPAATFGAVAGDPSTA